MHIAFVDTFIDRLHIILLLRFLYVVICIYHILPHVLLVCLITPLLTIAFVFHIYYC